MLNSQQVHCAELIEDKNKLANELQQARGHLPSRLRGRGVAWWSLAFPALPHHLAWDIIQARSGDRHL